MLPIRQPLLRHADPRGELLLVLPHHLPPSPNPRRQRQHRPLLVRPHENECSVRLFASIRVIRGRSSARARPSVPRPSNLCSIGTIAIQPLPADRMGSRLDFLTDRPRTAVRNHNPNTPIHPPGCVLAAVPEASTFAAWSGAAALPPACFGATAALRPSPTAPDRWRRPGSPGRASCVPIFRIHSHPLTRARPVATFRANSASCACQIRPGPLIPARAPAPPNHLLSLRVVHRHGLPVGSGATRRLGSHVRRLFPSHVPRCRRPENVLRRNVRSLQSRPSG